MSHTLLIFSRRSVIRLLLLPVALSTIFLCVPTIAQDDEAKAIPADKAQPTPARDGKGGDDSPKLPRGTPHDTSNPSASADPQQAAPGNKGNPTLQPTDKGNCQTCGHNNHQPGKCKWPNCKCPKQEDKSNGGWGAIFVCFIVVTVALGVLVVIFLLFLFKTWGLKKTLRDINTHIDNLSKCPSVADSKARLDGMEGKLANLQQHENQDSNAQRLADAFVKKLNLPVRLMSEDDVKTVLKNAIPQQNDSGQLSQIKTSISGLTGKLDPLVTLRSGIVTDLQRLFTDLKNNIAAISNKNPTPDLTPFTKIVEGKLDEVDTRLGKLSEKMGDLSGLQVATAELKEAFDSCNKKLSKEYVKNLPSKLDEAAQAMDKVSTRMGEIIGDNEALTRINKKTNDLLEQVELQLRSFDLAKAMRDNLADAQSKAENGMSQLQALNTEKTRIADELASKNREIEVISENFLKADEARTAAIIAKADLERQSENLKTDFDRAQAEAREAKDKLKNEQDLHQAAETAKATAESTKAALELQVANLKTEGEKTHAQLTVATTKLKTTEENLRAAETAKNTIESIKKTLEQQLTSLKATAEKTQAQLSISASALKTTESTLDAYKSTAYPAVFQNGGSLAPWEAEIDSRAMSSTEARILRSSLTMLAALESAGGGSVLPTILMETGRNFTAFLRTAMGYDIASIRTALDEWAVALTSNSENRYALSVPSIGEPVKYDRMSPAPGTGEKVKEVLSWSVHTEKGLVSKAEVR